MQTLTLDQLRAANTAGGVADVTLRAVGGLFFVSVTTRGGGDGVLVKTRTKAPRGFADPAKAMALLHEIGILAAHLDTARWTPKSASTGKPRPDRAAALRRTHEAARHDAWFRSEVEAGLRELEAPNVELIDHDEVMARFRAQEAEWLKRAGEPTR